MYEEKKKGRGLEGLFELARGEKIKKKNRHPYVLCVRHIENNNVPQTLSKVDRVKEFPQTLLFRIIGKYINTSSDSLEM